MATFKEFYAKNGIVTPGVVTVTNTTESTSTITGAIVVSGGAGFSGAVYASSFNGSASGLTAIPAGQLTGTIPSSVLGNSTHYIGTTAVTLNRASGSLALTGISSIDGSSNSLKSNVTTGLMQIVGPAAGTTRVVTIPDSNCTLARTDAGQTFTGNQTLSGIVSFTNTTASTSESTGAVILSGGFATNARNTMTVANDTVNLKFSRIGSSVGATYIGCFGDRDTANTYDSFVIYNGAATNNIKFSIKDSGIVSVESNVAEFNINSGLKLTVSNMTSSTNSTTGAEVISGGLGVGENINAAGYVKGTSLKTGNATIQYNSTSNTLDFIFV